MDYYSMNDFCQFLEDTCGNFLIYAMGFDHSFNGQASLSEHPAHFFLVGATDGPALTWPKVGRPDSAQTLSPVSLLHEHSRNR